MTTRKKKVAQKTQPERKEYSLDDYENLPPDLKKELSNRRVAPLYDSMRVMLEIFDAHVGALDIDEILVALYNKTGKVHKRTAVSARLSYMVNTGRIKRTSPGVYAAL